MTRRRIRDIRNEELIDATIQAVYDKGYSLVTMAEIAEEAGASAASINYYFGSKDRLMEATMRRLLTILKTATLDRLKNAHSPQDRLLAVLDANFDDRLFTVEQCSIWMQFWANAPYFTSLSRLHRINRRRVQSHFRAELRHLVGAEHRETVRVALQCYMDGVWLEAAQAARPLDPQSARAEARRVAGLMISGSPD
ncbi:transcriptional regulator BetI [Cognatishimia sp. WU-CL00825]|uniref:choline-binding transcriptional repressor BetI n=1 Tax=Cognatishimia sp. WU-CL00825 TaxID=3127658 RepID=UPI0031021089